MAYRSGYRRGGYRSAPTVGRVSKPNRRPGACRTCGKEVPAMGRQLWREESGEWSVVHQPAQWAGSPVSGQLRRRMPGGYRQTQHWRAVEP